MSNYTDLKNHLHNTLAITKDQIRTMVEKAVYKVVERKVEVLLRNQVTVQRLVDDAITTHLNKHNWMWGESETKLSDYIKGEVVRKLLDGVRLKVEIAKYKKEIE